MRAGKPNHKVKPDLAFAADETRRDARSAPLDTGQTGRLRVRGFPGQGSSGLAITARGGGATAFGRLGEAHPASGSLRSRSPLR